MDIKDHYRWEAKTKDGAIIDSGEFIESAVMFSFIPNKEGLPRHDIVGVELIKRFNRAFLNGFTGKIREYLLCCVCNGFRFYVRSSDGTSLITDQNYELYL